MGLSCLTILFNKIFNKMIKKLGFVLFALLSIENSIIEKASAQRQRRRRQDTERDITAVEIEEITDDNTIEDDPDELAKKAMMEEWDTHMSDFVPDDMLTVELQPREEISLHEDAPVESIYMRGAYFVNSLPGGTKEDSAID